MSSEAKQKASPLGLDPHSHANYADVRTEHIHLHVAVDFKLKSVRGYVDITARVLNPAVSTLRLDSKNLAIHSAQDLDSGAALAWTLPQHHPELGQCLEIPFVRRNKGDLLRVRVHYATTEASGGIQWLDAEQTAGKRHPFMYTQCEAILARTLLPCQDTPAVKAPYSIDISCPPPLVALCSGVPASAAGGSGAVFEEDGSRVFSWKQTNPIPAYLIAIVCGRLESAKVGPRSTVWSEPPLVAACKHEFEEHTELYVKAGEAVCGVPYDWGVYDMVVLPGAFPYGGMENPNLTFLSKSLLAGDRSLTNVVAHEITHSWAGNYVTNANWSDFWLNEGFTVYIERLILGEVFKSSAYRDFEALCGYNDLIKTVSDLITEHPEWTKLCPDLTGVDPDEAFSKIPYEKGSLFLLFLETQVGGAAAMRGWLKTYFEQFRNKSLNTAEMKAHFLRYFEGKVKAEVLNAIPWDEWLHSAGLPKFDPNTVLDRSLVKVCETLADKWKTGADGAAASGDDLKDFKAKQTMYFLDKLLTTHMPLKHDVLAKMDSLYGLSAHRNVEINFRFLMLSLKSQHRAALPHARAFLAQHGRGLYVKPLYKAMLDLDRDYAAATYKMHRSFYHSVIRHYCERLDLHR